MSDGYNTFNSQNYQKGNFSEPFEENNELDHTSDAFANLGFRIHLIVYLSVIGFLLFIDLLTGPSLWVHFPALCWGLGLAIHFWVIYILTLNLPGNKIGLYIHLSVQGSLILFLFLLDLFTSSRLDWFYFPSLPLAVAAAIHYGVEYYRQPRKDLGNQHDHLYSRYYEMLAQEKYHLGGAESARNEFLARKIVLMRVSFYIHAVVFFSGFSFFFLINLLTNFRTIWFQWPVMPWALGLFEHGVAVNFQIRRYRGEFPTKWYHLWYPAGVCIYLMFIDLFTGSGLDWSYYPILFIAGLAVLAVGLTHELPQRKMVTPYDEVKESSIAPIHPPTKISDEELSESSQQAQKHRFCSGCGAEIESQYRFCQYCGKKIRTD